MIQTGAVRIHANNGRTAISFPGRPRRQPETRRLVLEPVALAAANEGWPHNKPGGKTDRHCGDGLSWV